MSQQEHRDCQVLLCLSLIILSATNLPKRLAMMPPLKPPSMPPMAKMDTANEYSNSARPLSMFSLYRSSNTSLMNFSMFWKCMHTGWLSDIYLLLSKLIFVFINYPFGCIYHSGIVTELKHAQHRCQDCVGQKERKPLKI